MNINGQIVFFYVESYVERVYLFCVSRSMSPLHLEGVRERFVQREGRGDTQTGGSSRDLGKVMSKLPLK